MKLGRCLMVLFLTMMSQMAMSQNHVKIAGVPLTGTISEFSAKLQAKGYTISPDNKTAGLGSRIFDGVFMNEKASLIVGYDVKTKIVYNAHVVFEEQYETEDYAKTDLMEICRQIERKYSVSAVDGENRERESCTKEMQIPNGYAWLWITDEIFYYQLHLQYDDKENMIKHKSQISDDI